MDVFQIFNKEIDAYVKIRKGSNGKTKIVDVKQRQSDKPFKGVKIR